MPPTTYLKTTETWRCQEAYYATLRHLWRRYRALIDLYRYTEATAALASYTAALSSPPACVTP